MPKVQLENGATIHYETRGHGKPLLFIHGSGVSWRMWEPQFDAFSKEFQMIMIDLRGHGDSSKEFPDGQYSARVCAEDIYYFLNALQIEKIPVIGLSQGGVVASLFACRYPTYVEKLVLSNSYSEIPTNVAGWILSLSNAIFRLLPYSLILKLVVLPYGRDEYTKKVILDSLSIDKEMLLSLKTSEFPNHTQDLHKISAPTLVMAGDKKNVGPEVIGSTIIYEQIPNAMLAIFKNAFDPLSTMRRDRFNEILLDFLADRELKEYEDVRYSRKSD